MTEPITIRVTERSSGTLTFESQEEYDRWLASPEFTDVSWSHSENDWEREAPPVTDQPVDQ